MALRLARTNEEAHLYMDLHPCKCGEIEFPRSSSVVETADGDLASHYAGTCPQDGTRREFTFRLPQAIASPPGDGSVSYGGAEPSELIDPGEWLSIADAYARNVPSDTASLAADGLVQARSMLTRAVAAIDEVLKFIPAGDDRVPKRAFVSDRGRAAYTKEPGRFRRPRLDAVRSTYASIAAQL
jgi:hypothetical protein